MSYENPRAVIDTQSAQGLQRLQNTIAGTFAGVVKSYKADKDAVTKKLEKRELENRKRREEFQKQEDTLYENTSKTTARYGIEQSPELNVQIDEYSDLKNANNSGTLTSEEVSINKQKIAAKEAIPARTVGLYEGITESALSLKDTKEKDGDYGGLDKFGDPEIYEDLSTWIGTSPGSRKLSLKPLDNGIDLEIYAVINGRKYSSTQIERLRGKDSELLTRVPDPRPEFSDLTTASFMTVDPNTGKKLFKKGVLGKEKIDFDTDEDGNVYRVVTNLTNETQLKATGRIEAKASIEALSPRARAALWNNKLAPRDSRGKLIEGKKDDPVKLYSTEEASSPDFIEKLEEAWVNEWFKTNIGSEVEISRVKVKVDKPTKQEIDRLKKEEKYKQSVAILDAYEDDLSFNVANKIDSFNRILKFASQPAIGLAESITVQEKSNDKEGDDQKDEPVGFTVKFLDGKGAAAVKAGMSDKQIRNILKRAMIGGGSFYKEKPIKKSKGKLDNLNKEN